MDESTAELLELLINSYDQLISLLHLPRIEQELYEELFVQALRRRLQERKAPENGKPTSHDVDQQRELDVLCGALKSIVVALKKHQGHTVAVLKHVSRRENLVSQLIDLCAQYETGKCVLDEVQVLFLIILEKLCSTTFCVVQAIRVWREQLSRAYPFYIAGSEANYLERIADDCQAITNSALGRSLRLRLDTFPCGSNINFSRILWSRRVMWRARLINTGAIFQEGAIGFTQANVDLSMLSKRLTPAETLRSKPPLYLPPRGSTSPSKMEAQPGTPNRTHFPASGKEKYSQLLQAERIILKESLVQQDLAQGLYELADVARQEEHEPPTGKFLLTVRLPELFGPSEPSEKSSFEFAFPLDKAQWKDTCAQFLNQKHCKKVAMRARQVLCCHRKRFSSALRFSQCGVSPSTPRSTRAPPASSSSSSFSFSSSTRSPCSKASGDFRTLSSSLLSSSGVCPREHECDTPRRVGIELLKGTLPPHAA